MGSNETTFIEELCKRSYHLKIVFAIATFFLVIQLPYPFVIDHDSALFVVVVLNLFGASAFMLLTGIALRKCRALRRGHR